MSEAPNVGEDPTLGEGEEEEEVDDDEEESTVQSMVKMTGASETRKFIVYRE